MTIAKPTQVATPFANSGLKNSIPQSATGSNLASLEEGFPAVTMTAVGDGGEPPQGQDFNGILNQVTSQLRYAQAGGLYPYDSTFCAAIGGYPLGAILMSADGSKLWQNQVAGNANDPDSDDTNWTELCTVDALTAGLATKQGTLTFDSTPTANSSNPVTSGGVKTALDAKQDTLTFDSTPTADSTNPVTSDGILTALNTLSDAQLQALSSAISEIRGTAGSSAVLSDYLPLAGGEMTGNVIVSGRTNTAGGMTTVVSSGQYAKGVNPPETEWHLLAVAAEAGDYTAADSTGNSKRYGFVDTAVNSDGSVFTQIAAVKNLAENSQQVGIRIGWDSAGNAFAEAAGKEVERFNSFEIGEGGGWIRYESGLQICGGYVNGLTATADTKITFPKAFTVAPDVVTSRTSGASTTSDVAIWKRGSPTTTYFNVYATGATNMTYIAFGRWK